ncbi:M16 family metallopeptidase [Cohnella nanjingensis]|uniref:Insulinase family protein n=1 Tax=Cohnella nanjingensis TaxID=1387779 RepID=A0A7X0VG89_9BACL|nr:pitrilysin family protein [Cohnella nanjingensis]MBB6672862.1 insulinase family protein [Cohnella nanjingensis]
MNKYTLKNGLRVMIESIPTCRSVSFGIWVKTGSRYESPEDNGISHFIEHMLFKGTKRHSAKEIADRFDGIGGNVNAFTSKEYTCYYAKVLDQHLPIAVDILSDMFFESQLADEELAKEKNVILEEISMYEDTPDDTVHDLASKAAYGDHPLAYSILGTAERLNAMGPQDLRRYMSRQYTVGNVVVSLAGNVGEEALELLERHFGRFDVRAEASTLARPVFRSDALFHQKKTEQNHLCLTFPGCSIGDPKMYAMTLLNNAIGGGMSSRLFQEIREKRGLAYSVYSYHTSYADSGLFTVYAGTAPKQTQDVYDLTMELLGEISAKGLSEAEVNRGKEQLKGNLILSLESTSSRMNRLGKNELMLGRHLTLDQMIERIDAVTMDDVNEMMGRIMGEASAVALVGGNEKVLSGLGREFVVSSSIEAAAGE